MQIAHLQRCKFGCFMSKYKIMHIDQSPPINTTLQCKIKIVHIYQSPPINTTL